MSHVTATVPYPWPFDGAEEHSLAVARLAVIVCGAQRHWADTVDTTLGVTPEQVLGLVGDLRSLGVLVVWIRTGASTAGTRPIDRTLPVVGSAGWGLLVEPAADDLVIDTPGHDGFAVLWLEAELRARGIDRLALVGFGTETTVSGTNRSANDRGFECLTVTDAVAHHEKTTGEAALSSICMSGGIFGAIGTSDELLAALTRDQRTERDPEN